MNCSENHLFLITSWRVKLSVFNFVKNFFQFFKLTSRSLVPHGTLTLLVCKLPAYLQIGALCHKSDVCTSGAPTFQCFLCCTKRESCFSTKDSIPTHIPGNIKISSLVLAWPYSCFFFFVDHFNYDLHWSQLYPKQ